MTGMQTGADAIETLLVYAQKLRWSGLWNDEFLDELDHDMVNARAIMLRLRREPDVLEHLELVRILINGLVGEGTTVDAALAELDQVLSYLRSGREMKTR